MYDEDIKIAGNKPSQSVRQNAMATSHDAVLDEKEILTAENFGKRIAEEFRAASTAHSDAVEEQDENMLIQRHLLLSFTVTIGVETYIKSEAAQGVALKSFLDTVKDTAPDLYKYTSDTGAFSFYYLAHRRGSEVERRIGQTFAMLCAHDGDPIYQELGEVLYCWFSSRIKTLTEEFGLS